MRAFLGISLPEQIRASLVTLQEQLAESQADVKWVAPEQLHVTLKFLNEISEERTQQVTQFLRSIAQKTPAFMLQLQDLGAFPSVSDPRILWVGVREGGVAVVALAAAIEEQCRAYRLKREDRAFSAHATIGRVRSPRRREALVQRLRETTWDAPASWRATSVTFYQSVLGQAGPTYTVLAELPLASPSSIVDSP